jgi:hypothetical protein
MMFSDIPVSVAFVVLSCYSLILGDIKLSTEHMDSFFAGAVAFQMIISNIIWTVNDDAIIEKITNKYKKKKKEE